ncbi:MAG: hypothetical protein RML36_16585 [Anaerolineae bacterium]|nr:hypothetical protein [Anaerolineae bacterium]MDW8101091.1 hypothetical protein [Anaerolineae bacterium]
MKRSLTMASTHWLLTFIFTLALTSWLASKEAWSSEALAWQSPMSPITPVAAPVATAPATAAISSGISFPILGGVVALLVILAVVIGVTLFRRSPLARQ